LYDQQKGHNAPVTFIPADYFGTVFPCFFPDARKIGCGGAAMWISVLIADFVLSAFLFRFYDRIEYQR